MKYLFSRVDRGPIRFHSTFRRLFRPESPKEHYENLELNVDPSISRKRIKEQYQRLAFKWHPDRNTESGSAEKFARITESYKILIDGESRRDYDNWLAEQDSLRRDMRASSGKNLHQYWQDRGDERWVDHRAGEYERLRRSMTGIPAMPKRTPAPTFDDLQNHAAVWKRAREEERQRNTEARQRLSDHSDNQTRMFFLMFVIIATAALSIRSTESEERGRR